MNGATAAGMLRAKAGPDNAGNEPPSVVLSKDQALAIADLLKPENGDSPITHAEIVKLREFIHAQGQQMITMGAAMRLMRVYILTSIEWEESGEIAQYMAAWIDDGRWLPHKWPEQWPGVCRWLLDIGFAPVGGMISIPPEQIGDRAQAAAQRGQDAS